MPQGTDDLAADAVETAETSVSEDDVAEYLVANPDFFRDHLEVLSFMNMPLLTYIDEISPRPMLVIAGSEAHSRYFSEDAVAAAAEPKELMIIDGADHVDLYDQVDIIPFDKLEAFFSQNLA